MIWSSYGELVSLSGTIFIFRNMGCTESDPTRIVQAFDVTGGHTLLLECSGDIFFYKSAVHKS